MSIPKANRIDVIKLNKLIVIIAGNKAANDFATAGGTPSGILITNLGLPDKRWNSSPEISAIIKAINNPVAPMPSKPPTAKNEATETVPAAMPSFP